MSVQSSRERNITISSLVKMKQAGEKFACLTAYDYCSAYAASDCGVEVILVGDSLGMVMLGDATTKHVTMEDMVRHTSAVRKGVKRALLVTDMPIDSFITPDQAVVNANLMCGFEESEGIPKIAYVP